MSWDDYTEAVFWLSMPEGDINVAPAPLGSTVGAYPEDDRPIHIVTAHNPGGRPASAAANDKGHARLLARIRDAELTHFPAAGGDRAWTHVEAGVAIVGLDDVQAREFGREFGQDAIFEWSPTALAILSCTTRRARYTGWTATPVETPTETSPPPDTPVQDVTPNASSLDDHDDGPEYDSPGAGVEKGDFKTRKAFLAVYPDEEHAADIFFEDED